MFFLLLGKVSGHKSFSVIAFFLSLVSLFLIFTTSAFCKLPLFPSTSSLVCPPQKEAHKCMGVLLQWIDTSLRKRALREVESSLCSDGVRRFERAAEVRCLSESRPGVVCTRRTRTKYSEWILVCVHAFIIVRRLFSSSGVYFWQCFDDNWTQVKMRSNKNQPSFVLRNFQKGSHGVSYLECNFWSHRGLSFLSSLRYIQKFNTTIAYWTVYFFLTLQVFKHCLSFLVCPAEIGGPCIFSRKRRVFTNPLLSLKSINNLCATERQVKISLLVNSMYFKFIMVPMIKVNEHERICNKLFSFQKVYSLVRNFALLIPWFRLILHYPMAIPTRHTRLYLTSLINLLLDEILT